jgi:hypothetical protein
VERGKHSLLGICHFNFWQVECSFSNQFANRFRVSRIALPASCGAHHLVPVIDGWPAVAVVGLMQKTFDAIAPQKIIDEFVAVQDDKPAARADALWKSLGRR